MLDFTSALYLGLRHPSWALQPWAQLTTGRPAALVSLSEARSVAQELAALQGCERSTLAPSTLHLFWDLFGMVASGKVAIHMDGEIYPIARWGVERAAARGVPVRSFPHHDVDALRRQLKWDAMHRVRPVVVADGLCPGCGGPGPIAAYVESLRTLGGQLILDDTQALGILGYSPGSSAPYGKDGGGSLRWHNIKLGRDILMVSSLAKAFGVPVAALSGSHDMVRQFEEKSETRVHSSPPSVAVIRAAEHALAVNQQHGDALRLHLTHLVSRFRKRLARAGFSTAGGPFPVQTLGPVPELGARTLHERLLEFGVRSVLHARRNGHEPSIGFLITALHDSEQIDRAVEVIAQATNDATRTQQAGRLQ